MDGSNQTRLTELYREHEKLRAHFTDFGGWNMPLRYGSELSEHRAVREAAGLFDLSHMGEVWLTGPDAATVLNTALVGNLAAVTPGRAKYSLMCHEDGGILDDLIVYRVAETRYLVVPNAGNTEAVVAALRVRSANADVSIRDASAETALLALQGPNAEAILGELAGAEQRTAVTELRYYAWAQMLLPVREQQLQVFVARTGYTGEDGFELYLPKEHAAALWHELLQRGASRGLIPAGLAARDSLRLEAGMPLYGNELSAEVHPFAAGLGAVVSFKKPEPFVGRSALERVKAAPRDRVLVGLRGAGRRAARCGYPVAAEGRQIGQVTSGLLSPTLGHPIALAYLEPAFAEAGTTVEVDLRGRAEPFEVTSLPFYTRTR